MGTADSLASSGNPKNCVPPICSWAEGQEFATNGGAFAAVKSDGSVVTWGDPRFGGDSTRIWYPTYADLELGSSESGESD